MSQITIFAARRVVPPDLIAPAARSPIFRKLISPDDLPPPASRSFSPRSEEKLVPVPEPYLNSRASRVQRSMIPPSLTRSSVDRLDEAGVRLRVLVGAGRLHQLARLEVDVEVPLPRPVDAVGPVQPGVEPLRRVRRAHLRRQHVAHLVVVGARVGLGREVAALPAPVGPGAGQPVEDLPRAEVSPPKRARPRAARRASPRRRPSARGTTARPSRAPASAPPAPRPCGSTSAPARRRRPGSSPRAPRCPRG